MEEAAEQDRHVSAVREMFSRIAKRYDLANDVLSLGIQRLWKQKALRALDLQAGENALDVCCGTGDLSFLFARQVGSNGTVWGIDFCRPMLRLALDKKRRLSAPNQKDQARVLPLPHFASADAEHLPFAAAAFDAAGIAFGIRNVARPECALREMHRVLRPGARIVVLEFGRPKAMLVDLLFRFYCAFVMPRLGGLLTGNRYAYEYLPRTARKFPCRRDFLAMLQAAGFVRPSMLPLSCGIAYLYTAHTPS